MLNQMARAYFENEEGYPRRFSGRGHGYPLSHERDLPPAPGHGVYPAARNMQLSHHENRHVDHPQDDSNGRPRSRIPVAVSKQMLVDNSNTLG